MIQFRVLGEVAVVVDGQRSAMGGARLRRLVAMLLIHRNTVVSVDRLADAVFAGEPTDAAATTLRSYIARVRRVVEGHDDRVGVFTQPPGYCLRVPDELFDAATFEALVGDAGRSLLRGDPEAAGASARQAIEQWTGDPYPEFDDEAWVQPEAQRLQELRLVAADRYFEAELGCGRASDVVSEIERMVRGHPVREGFRSQLMLALYRSGRQADALRAYQDFRAFLVDELGLEPSPQLADLEARILAHDASLVAEDGGRSLHGYRLGDRLGAGRDGALFAARIPGVERDFVMRSFRSEVADDPHFVRTFESDAHRLASLRHPAIVPVHDYWRGPHEAYLVTSRMRGGTLDDRLRRGPLAEHEFSSLVARIGSALVDASAAGLAHGRISPLNVLFDDHQLPYLTDFGLGDEQASVAADTAAFAALLERCTTSDAMRLHLDRAERDSSTSMASLVGAVLVVLDASPVKPANPYKGLEAFDEVDTAEFFGREVVVDDIVKRLHEADARGRLVLVVGGSGTGKSSVVRAGLLPRLRAGAVPGSAQWLITTITPGGSPFQRLGEALTRLSVDEPVPREGLDRPGAIDRVVRRVAGDAEIVIVLDQLEELFTLADFDTQRRFLDELVEAVDVSDSRLRVVATLRADFFDRPLAVASIGHLLSESTVPIPAMTPAELEAAIVEPARRVGRHVEGRLIAELVSAVVNDAAALPALQFTLYELAERCNSTLTLEAYRELGGLSGAVAKRADQLYRSVGAGEQLLIRRLFERMIVVRDGEAMRRRLPISDVASGPDGAAIDAVIERWVVARLLTRDRDPRSRAPTVEVAHEALVREWPRLQRWIAEDREAIALTARIHDAALAWAAAERDPESLARGLLLEAAAEAADGGHGLDLSPLEHEFVDSSRRAREAAAAEQAIRLAREQRSNRRLRWQLVALGCLLISALVVGLVALDQRRTADQARRIATGRELAAAAQASLDVDPERSMLLALEAIDVTRGNGQAVLPEAVTALHAAVVGSRIEQRIEGVGGTVAWSPTDEYLVSEGPEDSGVVDLRDPVSGESVRTWIADDVDINDVAFSSDGSLLATTGDDGAMRVWDPGTGELQFEHRVPDGGGVWGPSFSADGSTVAASWLDEGVVRAFDATSGQLVGEGDAERVIATSLNSDGSLIAVGAGEGTAYVAEVGSNKIVHTLEAPDAGWMRIVRFSPDDRQIAATGGDGITRVWDAATGARALTVGEPGAAQAALSWSWDSRMLAVGSADGSTHIIEVGGDEARPTLTLTAQDTQNGVQGVAFSPDGTRLATGDLGIASIIVWDIAPLADREWANANTETIQYVPLAVTASDEVVVSDIDGNVVTYSMEDGTKRQIIDSRIEVGPRFAVDPAGSIVATADGTPSAPVRIWDAVTGAEIVSFTPPDFDEFVTGLAWSPDGEHLAVSGGDGDSSSIVVVDRAGAVVARFVEEPGVYLRNSYFSPDGTVLAIPRRPLRQGVPDQQGLWLWDWSAERMVGRIDTQTLAADWDPTGQRIVTVSELESVGEVWAVGTGERITSFAGTSGFTDVRFSPDGSEVAATSVDGDVNLWDAEDGTLEATLRGHDVAISLAYSHDGRRLASVDADGMLRVWALDLDDLIGIAEQRLTRRLTGVECRQFLHRDTC